MAVEKRYPEVINPAMFCAGCGHGVLTRLIGECLEEYGVDKKTIIAIGMQLSSEDSHQLRLDTVSPRPRSSGGNWYSKSRT